MTILGTSPHAIRLSEDRAEFAKLLQELDIPQPENGIIQSLEEACEVAQRIGYPVLVRPSFVLGGRAMALVESEEHLAGFIEKAIEAAPGQPILIDKFVEDAFEIDVDALSDGERVRRRGGDAAYRRGQVSIPATRPVLPPYKVSAYHQGIMREYTEQLGLALGVRGLMNVQFALKDEVVYVSGSESVCFTDCAICQQSHGIESRVCRRTSDGRKNTGGTWRDERATCGRIFC